MHAAKQASPSGASNQLQSLLEPFVRVTQSTEQLRAIYQNASPFPHVIIDDLFSAELLDRVVAEAATLTQEQWLNVEQAGLERIDRLRSGVDIRTAGSQLIGVLHSATFLYLLSEITGIWQLLPDPYLQGAGHARMQRDGYFKIHSDRNVAYDTGLRRRLAMIIFLNRDWPAEYRGELEFWDPQAKGCEVSIAPLFNRTVIFEVAHPNYHGVPHPLACPPSRVRRSFMAYYHTAGAEETQKVMPHTSIFAPGFYRKKKSALHRLAEQVAPPFLLGAIRSIARRFTS
jgi:2OG-Fe(II) oxygenase superfamily